MSPCAGTTVCIVGQQKFSGSFNGQTEYGTSGAITGAYTGDYGVGAANRYGGAQGTESYLATCSSTGYTITLTHSASLPGINYFGFWLSAPDRGNQLEVLRGGTVVDTCARRSARIPPISVTRTELLPARTSRNRSRS